MIPSKAKEFENLDHVALTGWRVCLATRSLAAFALLFFLIVTVWGQNEGQGAPGGPPQQGGMPGGPGAMPGGAGGPGGPGGGGNIGAMAETKAPVVSAAQLSFSDFDSVKNKEAVETLYDFGLMDGCASANGGRLFCPEKSLVLGDLAKAVALSTVLVRGDVPSDYIAYCIKKGLLKGTGSSDKAVTGYETAGMLLSAMGVKGVNGGDRSAITEASKLHNLVQGIESVDLSQVITRDNAAQMIANALRLSDGSGMIPKVLHNVSVGIDSGNKTIDNTRIFFLGGTAVQDSGNSTLVVRNSRIDGDTSEKTKPLSGPPGGLLVAGSIRTTLTLGQAQSFYINSIVNSRNWASLSTDAAKPISGAGQKELALYAYGTKARTIDGGYGTYSDLFCNIYLYGTNLKAAEIGIVSGTYGKVTVGNLKDGEMNEALAEHLSTGDKSDFSGQYTGSVITGGRNALMIHSVNLPPYWGYKGYSKEELPLHSASISIHGSTLATDLSANRKLDYSPEQQAYIDHHAGSVILIKSANADIDLNQVSLYADRKGTGALIHTVINNDTGFMTKVPDGTNYPGSKIKMTGMNVEGNILHEDYQRDMHLALAKTSLTGKITSGTAKDWNALCKEKGMEKYIIDPDGYKTMHGVNLTLDPGSVWKVTGESALTALTIEDGAHLTVPQGYKLAMTVNGTDTPIKAGSYQGKIVIYPARP
jgi:hypothetical protein